MNLTNFNPVIILAGLIAVAIGLADAWYFHKFGDTSDTMYIIGGLSALGVHFLNGSATAVVNAVQQLKDAVPSANVQSDVTQPPVKSN